MNLNRSYTAVEAQKSRHITEELISWLRGYFSSRVNSRWIDERRCIPPYIVLEFARKGLLGFHIEEAQGGLGLSCEDSVRLITQLGALDATISQLVLINALAIRPLMSHGSEHLKTTYLSALARGEYLGAFAQTEEQAGTNFTRIKTQAAYDRTKQKWVISGDKYWIGNAGWSGMITLICRTLDEDNQDSGLSCFLVPTDSPGVHIGDELNSMGLRGVVQNKIQFSNVEIDQSMLIGRMGRGLEVAVDAMSFTRITIAAQQVGLMKKSIVIMHGFMAQREISSGRLLDNPVAVNMLSECIARILVIENFLKKIAVTLDQERPVSLVMSALCKVIATEFAGYITDKTLQFLGGRGYDENNLLPQLVRDTRVTRIFEGPSEALISFAGARVKYDGGQREFATLFTAESAEKIAAEVQQGIAAAKQQAATHALDAEQQTRWLDYKAGLLAAWAVLKLSATDVPEAKAAIDGWLDNGYADMPGFVSGDCFLAPELIHTAILSFRDAIGDVQQTIPGLNWEPDALIKATTSLDSTLPKEVC